MKTTIVLAAIASLSMALSSTAAFAAPGDPIPGIEVRLEGDPGSILISRGVTDDRGNVRFDHLAPGDYVIVIDGPTLVKAMDARAPSKPDRHGGGSSLTIGIGGTFGGSHHSHEDAGPTGGERHSGRIGGAAVDPNDPSGNRVNNGGSSTGGVGLGLNVPLGGHDTNPEPGYPIINISVSIKYPRSQGAEDTIDWGDGTSTSTETAYCRDSAIHGTKLHVTNLRGGTIILSIFDRWGNLSAISENESPLPSDR